MNLLISKQNQKASESNLWVPRAFLNTLCLISSTVIIFLLISHTFQTEELEIITLGFIFAFALSATSPFTLLWLFSKYVQKSWAIWLLFFAALLIFGEWLLKYFDQFVHTPTNDPLTGLVFLLPLIYGVPISMILGGVVFFWGKD